jgi:hypothetical protein
LRKALKVAISSESWFWFRIQIKPPEPYSSRTITANRSSSTANQQIKGTNRISTRTGLPIGFALTGAKADERQTLLEIFHLDPTLTADRPGQTLIGDKNDFGAEFETHLAEAGLGLLRPARKGEPERPVRHCSSRYARPSNRSIRPSRANLTWNATAATPPTA